MISKSKTRATIADVSRIANVSMSTVSHVINGTRHVDGATKERVLLAIEQTGYTQNLVAKSLKNAKTKTIGLIISDLENPFFIEVISGIEYTLNCKGYSLILSDSNDDAKRECELVKNLYARQIDGLILSPTANSEETTGPYLTITGIPTVLIDRKVGINSDWVGIENIKAAKQLVNHLIQLGHRRIGIVSGLRGINTTEDRILGYKTALLEAEIDIDESLIIHGGSRSKLAEQNVLRFLSSVSSLPSALVVANNLMVLGTLRALKTMNLSVPEDMAVVSFDDFEWADLFQPRLTTMAQPCFNIGTTAVELLLNQLKEGRKQPREVYLQPTLTVRESCGSSLKRGE